MAKPVRPWGREGNLLPTIAHPDSFQRVRTSLVYTEENVEDKSNETRNIDARTAKDKVRKCRVDMAEKDRRR